MSEDVVAAVILDRKGEPSAATVDDDRANAVAEIAGGMLAYGDALRGEASIQRLEALTPGGSIFVLREGNRVVVAATGTDPVTGLVLHDLRSTLRKLGSRGRARANAAS